MSLTALGGNTSHNMLTTKSTKKKKKKKKGERKRIASSRIDMGEATDAAKNKPTKGAHLFYGHYQQRLQTQHWA